ncbi:MAG: tRNA preQ1(34) S-adenosylmethionine ribosyltransferase-isomerase QueA [Woeseiaceae bacterium]|nr:tRNA preQ1(34) S-adenosylmethionine ribosyltransferase-isomerase QueA [Woeseiaceae bacterium]
MRLADFDYELPDRLIARYPAAERRGSRLLVVDCATDSLADRQFADLPQLLRRNDLLVLNDTRVVRARLSGRKETGGSVEALIERTTGSARALAHLRANRKPTRGSGIDFGRGGRAAVLGRRGELTELEFDRPVNEVLEAHGEVPLPPYLRRDAESEDAARYQTVYARQPGAVAAPTAGLHFDESMLGELDELGIGHCFVTLHVGAGTFQSLRHETVDDNRLHSERVHVSRETADRINEAREAGGRVVAVGTTSVRALESALDGERVVAFEGETDLFIRPGYVMRSIDALLTNFHLPRSSLLMLVSALAGRERVLAAYRHAVESEYRFFSYGDAMLILSADRVP